MQRLSKILLYYKFLPISDPKAVMMWQRELCERLGLRGRILISEHGTVGGDMDACQEYIKKCKEYFGKMRRERDLLRVLRRRRQHW